MRRLVGSVVIAALAGGAQGAQGPDASGRVERVAGEPSTALTARLTSARRAPARGGAPGVTAGSGIVILGRRAYVAQDDSTLLAVLNGDGSPSAVRLLSPIEGADRFLSRLNNKLLKPDFEAIVAVAVPRRIAAALGSTRARRAVVVFGSGSEPFHRDRIAVVFPAERIAASRVVVVDGGALYDRLRGEVGLTGAGGQLNIEGAVDVDGGRSLRLFTRPTARGTATSSVDVGMAGFLEYLVATRRDAKAPFAARLANLRRYDLGASPDGSPIAITDATRVAWPRGGDALVFTAVAEETADVRHDGAVSGTTIGLELPDGRILLAPLREGGRPTALKVEGIALRSASFRRGCVRLALRGVVDPDADDLTTPSTLVEIELDYVERQSEPPATRQSPGT